MTNVIQKFRPRSGTPSRRLHQDSDPETAAAWPGLLWCKTLPIHLSTRATVGVSKTVTTVQFCRTATLTGSRKVCLHKSNCLNRKLFNRIQMPESEIMCFVVGPDVRPIPVEPSSGQIMGRLVKVTRSGGRPDCQSTG